VLPVLRYVTVLLLRAPLLLLRYGCCCTLLLLLIWLVVVVAVVGLLLLLPIAYARCCYVTDVCCYSCYVVTLLTLPVVGYYVACGCY